MKLRKVCVYAGSRPGADPAYRAAAERLGREIAQRGIGLVYGGGRVGLMGAVADAVLEAGGDATGVITRGLLNREIGHLGLTALEVVDSMHARKARMAELVDAFVALPGGLGTIEELVEAATWSQLGIHAKPVGLLDVSSYWMELEQLLDHAVRERFLRPEHRELLVRDRDPGALLDILSRAPASGVEKWLDRGGEEPPSAAVAPRGPRVGVSALVVRDRKLLLGMRRGAHGAGLWAPPGGAVRAGEPPAAAAARELHEETGLRSTDVRPVGYTHDVLAAERLHWVTLHHEVAAHGDPQVMEPRRNVIWHWFPADELPEQLFEPMRELLANGWSPGS